MMEAFAVELVTLHMIDGRVVQVNPAQVTQVISPHEGDNKVLVEGVNCVVRFTDGNFVSVAETCEQVRDALKGAKP